MAETETTAAAPKAEIRKPRRVLIGKVTRDKMDKTRRVEIQYLEKHPRYGKYIKRRTVCYAHDEANASRIGDEVEIMETRPLSKLKHWRLVRVTKKGPGAADMPPKPAKVKAAKAKA